MIPHQALEEALCRSPISFRLKEYVNNLTILVDRPPKIMLLAVDLNGPAHRRRLRR
jgi:hypothetical protein